MKAEDDLQKSVKLLKRWTLQDNAIEKTFTFKNFSQALQFIIQVGSLAEKMNHHPDIYNSYNKVKLRLTTHDAQALTQKDVELARAIDAI